MHQKLHIVTVAITAVLCKTENAEYVLCSVFHEYDWLFYNWESTDYGFQHVVRFMNINKWLCWVEKLGRPASHTNQFSAVKTKPRQESQQVILLTSK